MATKNTMADQAKIAMAPVKAINELNVDTTEQLVELQVGALQSYAKMAMAHWRAALEVTDVDGVKGFVEKHREFVKTVGETVAKDATSMVELGTEYAAEVQKVMKDSAEKATKKAA